MTGGGGEHPEEIGFSECSTKNYFTPCLEDFAAVGIGVLGGEIWFFELLYEK